MTNKTNTRLRYLFTIITLCSISVYQVFSETGNEKSEKYKSSSNSNEKSANNLLSVASVQQQNSIKITGTVLDANKEPMIGLTVNVKNSTIATVTDLDGRYVLNVPPASILVFSYIGSLTQEIKVSSSSEVNVTMNDNDKLLEEVVVVGYGIQRKKDLTGGLSVVGKDKLEMVSTSNLMDRLAGQVAGFTVTTTDAAPGKNQSLRIRGENSISASNDPLIVMDGIPYEGSLSDLDPNIIDNMTVLKDASSVAIYGSRGSNGVILIQTKRGKTGKAQVSYRGQFGLAEPMQRIDVMNPDEYIHMKQDIARIKDGWSGADLDPMNILSASERINYEKGITHNWQDYVFRTAFTMDHQISISGGTESTKYMAAIAHLDQNGVVYNSKLTRENVTMNIDQTFNKWLTIGIGSQFIQKETGGITPNLEHAIKQSPYGIYKDENGNYYPEPMDQSLIKNPMVNVNADQDNTDRNVFLNAYADILFPVKGLSFRTNFGYNYRTNFTGTYYGRNTLDGKNAKGGGKASISNTHNWDYTWENIAKYNRTFGKHQFDATGLFSVQQTQQKKSSQSAEGFVNDDMSYHNINAGENNQTISSNLQEYSMLSYMLRLNYAFNQKYLATLTGRTDGASVFGKNNKYAFFPSVAIAWNVAEENFMKEGVSWIDMLKLRLSYGDNGNQAIDKYRTLDRLYLMKYVWGDGGNPVNAVYLPNNGIGNPNLKWESTRTANLGIDFYLFGGRLSGNIDMYLSRTRDLLMNRTVPIMNGYSSIWDNVGQTENKGIEITLNSQNVHGTDFKWETNVNFALNRDKIVDLRGDKIDDVTNKWFIGKPLRVYYDYNWIGIWQEGDKYTYTTEDGTEKEIQKGAKPGTAKLEDVDGNGYIDQNDRKIIGSKMPSFTMSMGNRFTYKDFYFSFLLNGVFNVTREDNEANFGTWTYSMYNYVHNGDYWTPENPNAKYVAPGSTTFGGHGFYKKVTYVQLKNITLGYNINRNLTNKLGVSAINVNLSVNNLHTFSNVRNVLNYDNSWMASYPTTRSYMLGLNLTF